MVDPGIVLPDFSSITFPVIVMLCVNTEVISPKKNKDRRKHQNVTV